MPSRSGSASSSRGQEEIVCQECRLANLPALKAAAEGHVKCLRSAFASDPERSLACDSKGATALHLAARGGKLDCVKWLLTKSGLVATVKAKNGETPLHLTAAAGHLGCLQYIVTHDKSAASAVDRHQQTPLHLAVLRERFRCTKWLLEIAEANPLAATSTGATPLHFAAAQGYLKIVKLLLSFAPAERVDVPDEEGSTALYYAAQSGHTTVVEELIQCYHANPLAMAKDGMTPLHAAGQAGQVSVLQWLDVWLQGKHLLDQTSDGATLLHFAASMGKTQCLAWLLSLEKCSVGVNTVDKSGSTAAHDAAENGQLDCLQLLASHGCDVALKDNEGYTPYDLAFHSEHDECAAFLKAEETRRHHLAADGNSPTFTKYHNHGQAAMQGSRSSGSRYRDRELFHPTYSASSLMKALPDRMSSVSSMPNADVAEMASLDDLDLEGLDFSDCTPDGSIQNISTAHMLPALREQLEAMGMLAADLQVIDVESGLPPMPSSRSFGQTSADDDRKASSLRLSETRRRSEQGQSPSHNFTTTTTTTTTSRNTRSAAISLRIAGPGKEDSPMKSKTRSLSGELRHSAVDLVAAMKREEPDGSSGEEQIGDRFPNYLPALPRRQPATTVATAAVDSGGGALKRDKEGRGSSYRGPSGRRDGDDRVGDGSQGDEESMKGLANVSGNPPAKGTESAAVESQIRGRVIPGQLEIRGEEDESTPKVSPARANAPLLTVDPPTRPSSTGSDVTVERNEVTPHSSPRLSRRSSISTRLEFIPAMSAFSDSLPESRAVGELDERGIPVPPPAPTPQSLVSGIVNLQTVKGKDVPKWMKRYRRGWLAKTIGDSVRPDDELMVVLAVRKRLIDGFGQLIAKGAAQLSPSRPASPPSSPERLDENLVGDKEDTGKDGNDDGGGGDDLEISLI